MSKKIFLDEIREGMILAAPQVNRYGQILLDEGTKINDKHIEVLRTWGIEIIEILEDELEDQMVNGMNSFKKEAEKLLKVRMLFEPRNIYEVDMLRVAVNSKIKKLKDD